MLSIDGPLSSGMPFNEFLEMLIPQLLLGSWIIVMFLIMFLMAIDFYNWVKDRQSPV